MGDEGVVRSGMYGIDYAAPGEFLPYLVRTIGRDLSLIPRTFEVAKTLARLPQLMSTGQSHCEVGDRLALRFGFSESLRRALFQSFERFDGSGLPAHLKGARGRRSGCRSSPSPASSKAESWSTTLRWTPRAR